jgi:trans-aconitate methyltransferase
MERILEPELMENDDQACAYAEADFKEPHSNFIKSFQDMFGHRSVSGYVLDLGCGPGDITMRFARAFPDCIVHGIDGSEAMLCYGRKILAKAEDIRDRVQLLEGLLPGAVLPRRKYDIIISNSLLHHLGNPQVLWDAVKHYAEQGAPVFIMDLTRPATQEEARLLIEAYAREEPQILKHDFYFSLLAAFEVNEIAKQLNQAGLSYLSIKIVSDRHVVMAGNFA